VQIRVENITKYKSTSIKHSMIFSV